MSTRAETEYRYEKLTWPEINDAVELGKEATFVIYNHGDHSLSRHSRSDTLDVYQRMLDWFAKYLQ